MLMRISFVVQAFLKILLDTFDLMVTGVIQSKWRTEVRF